VIWCDVQVVVDQMAKLHSGIAELEYVAADVRWASNRMN
jgi:hypothetical protein